MVHSIRYEVHIVYEWIMGKYTIDYYCYRMSHKGMHRTILFFLGTEVFICNYLLLPIGTVQTVVIRNKIIL